MSDSKTLFASRTVWGAAIAILASLAGMAGLAVTPDDQAQVLGLVDEILGVWDRLVVVAGGALAIWGRISATRIIG